jgi:elongation factor P--(R)-beta-lysine ligase
VSGPVLSPTEARGHSGRIVVGGRVLAHDGRSVTIADAFSALQIALSEGDLIPVEAGDLVLIDALVVDGSVADGNVLERHPGRLAAAPSSDVHRFTLKRVGRALAARARALSSVRELMSSRGFLEVETPLVVPSPGLDVHLSAMETDGGYLITSPEYQMKRLVAGGVPRCFQLARCFRSGEQGALHNPEFTMLEWYRAFATYDDVMGDTEEIVRAVARTIGDGSLAREGRRIAIDRPFERITVAEAFERHAGIPSAEVVRLAAEDEDRYFALLVDRIEPRLAELDVPVFLVDYPASQASLARRKPDDPRFAERFELYAAGVELCNGFGELTDPEEQRARLLRDQDERRRRGLPVYPIDERFLRALEEGLPPCSGNALGMDRLIALSLGALTVGDVQAFPHGIL